MTTDSTRAENGTSRMRTGWQSSGPNQVDAAAGVGDDGEVRSGAAELRRRDCQKEEEEDVAAEKESPPVSYL